MNNRVITLEATKAYGDAFNKKDVAAIGALLDDQNVIFSRQEQNTIVGKENVLRRIRNLFWRMDEQHKSLEVVNAIIDLGNSKARPCLLCLVNHMPVAVCVLNCKPNGKIIAIAVLLSGAVVTAARPTEKHPSLEKLKGGEQKRADVVAVTKAYVSAINQRDFTTLNDLLDSAQCMFTRTDQRAVVGREAMLNRMRDSFRRIDAHGQELQLVNAIIDHDGKTSWPCTLGVLDGTPVSIAMLTVKPDLRISKIDVVLTPAVVQKARPTEPLPKPKAAQVDAQKLAEREEWLHQRAAKIEKAMKRDGNLPHLVTKKMRVEQELEKIKYLKQKMR